MPREPVEHSILERRRRGRMIDGDFFGDVRRVHQHRQETMQSIKTEKSFESRTLKNAKCAAGIAKSTPNADPARPTGNLLKKARRTPSVFALGANATDEIGIFQFRDTWQIGGNRLLAHRAWMSGVGVG